MHRLGAGNRQPVRQQVSQPVSHTSHRRSRREVQLRRLPISAICAFQPASQPERCSPFTALPQNLAFPFKPSPLCCSSLSNRLQTKYSLVLARICSASFISCSCSSPFCCRLLYFFHPFVSPHSPFCLHLSSCCRDIVLLSRSFVLSLLLGLSAGSKQHFPAFLFLSWFSDATHIITHHESCARFVSS